MKRLNYARLMAAEPTLLDSVVNQRGQKVDFYEHPTLGDTTMVIGVIEEHVDGRSLREAFYTDFFDTDDFHDGSDYNPVYMHGKVACAWEYDLT